MKLNVYTGPLARIPTPYGVLCLYAPSREHFKEIDETSPEARGRARLRRVVSLTDRKNIFDDVEPLPENIAGALSDDEIVAIADVFRAKLPLRRVRASAQRTRAGAAPRQPDESAAAYLDRVIFDELEYDAAEIRRVMNEAIAGIDGAAGQALKHLRGSSDELQATIDRQYRSMIEETRRSSDHMRREIEMRQEEREWTRGIHEMSACSAQALQGLVEASTAMMLRWDERNEEAKASTKKQLWWAAGSLLVTAALSIVSFGYTVLRDRSKDAADELAARAATAREERLVRALEQNAAAMQVRARDASGSLPSARPERRR